MPKRLRYLLVGLICLGLIGYSFIHASLANRYQKWVFHANESLTDPTICNDGTVLTYTERRLFALDGMTGKAKWSVGLIDSEWGVWYCARLHRHYRRRHAYRWPDTYHRLCL